MSAYENDKDRVRLNEDGSATIYEGAAGEGDWTVREQYGEWVVDNPEQGFLHDTINAAFPARFATRDEAIHAVIGDPQVTA